MYLFYFNFYVILFYHFHAFIVFLWYMLLYISIVYFYTIFLYCTLSTNFIINKNNNNNNSRLLSYTTQRTSWAGTQATPGRQHHRTKSRVYWVSVIWTNVVELHFAHKNMWKLFTCFVACSRIFWTEIRQILLLQSLCRIRPVDDHTYTE